MTHTNRTLWGQPATEIQDQLIKLQMERDDLLEALEAITESIRLGRVISTVKGGTYEQAVKAIQKARGE